MRGLGMVWGRGLMTERFMAYIGSPTDMRYDQQDAISDILSRCSVSEDRERIT